MLKLYDSLTQKVRPFESIEPKKVSMYVCGPTVYGDIHIGNARPVIFFDMLKTYLAYLGYDVNYVSNITDVDDRIIEKAIELGKKESEITETFTNNFIDVTNQIGSKLPDVMPKATHYISQMIAYIEMLITTGHAYAKPNGVYFKVDSIKDYGILSKQNLDDLNQGVRINLEDEKEDPKDFSIWKITEEGINYDSPWGKGRPGWHTECACMNHEIFKGEIDIHGGGSDLKFPHHENEIAQTMAISNHHLARTWMHVGRLDMNQEKMSKSLGNIILVKTLLETYDPFAFRLLILGHHYRQKIDYTDELMMQYQKEYDKIKRTMQKSVLTLGLNRITHMKADQIRLDRFVTWMNDDLNTPNVLTLIQEIVKHLNKESNPQTIATLYQTLKEILIIFGITFDVVATKDVLETYRLWESARLEKNYKEADYYRQKLIDQGWI
jgi:cysteinyl-tRNA synthetase